MSSDESPRTYSDEESEEDEGYEGGIGGRGRARLDSRQDTGALSDYAHAYARLDEDVLGDDESDDDGDEFLFDAGLPGKGKDRPVFGRSGEWLCIGTCTPGRRCYTAVICARPGAALWRTASSVEKLIPAEICPPFLTPLCVAGESESAPPYMFFDFRHGRSKWPEVRAL